MVTKETFTHNDVIVQMDLVEFDTCAHCNEPIRTDEYYLTFENDTRYCSDECFISECQRDGIITYRNKRKKPTTANSRLVCTDWVAIPLATQFNYFYRIIPHLKES